MGTYDRQVATAQRLIAKYGQQVLWQQEAAQVSDPDKPWQTSLDGDLAQYPVTIVFLSPKGGNFKADLAFLKGTDVIVGGVRGLMGAVSGFTPQAIDKVIRDGAKLAIKSIDMLHPNGQVILYTIEFVA